MSMTLAEKKDSKSLLRRIQGELSKYFVTAKSNTFEETSEYLGTTSIADDKSNISYVLYAHYMNHSTKENPIIGVRGHYRGEDICRQVYIRLINPKHATMLEMFALCSFADDIGLCKDKNTSFFPELRSYVRNAAAHGINKKITGYKEFCNKKIDWDSVINQVKDIYLKEEAFEQYQECIKLMDMFDHFYEKLRCGNS